MNTEQEKIYTIDQARKVDYTVHPIKCPSCWEAGEVVYNQYANYFTCSICGGEFEGK